MYRLIVIIYLFLSSFYSAAQDRIIKPEFESLMEQHSRFLPDNGIPFPDENEKVAAIAFYQKKLEGKTGQNNQNDQAFNLFCLSEINRLNNKPELSIKQLLQVNTLLKNKIDPYDLALLRSRIFFNVNELLKRGLTKDSLGIILKQFQLKDPDFAFDEALIVFQREQDDANRLAMLHATFSYYRLIKEFRAANNYGDQYISFMKYLSDRELEQQLKNIKKEKNISLRETEIQLLNNQNTILEERIRTSSRQNFAIIGGIGALVLLSLALWHRLNVIRKTKDLLELKGIQLIEEKKRAKRNEQAKEQFLATVSHEIRTPMNAIMGISNILIKNEHLKRQEKYLAAINESAKDLLDLINDILDLSKLEAGKVDLASEPFDLSDVFDSVYQSFESKANEKGLTFIKEIKDEIPQLRGDAHALRNILMNLVGNAITFTKQGKVEMYCKLSGYADGLIIVTFTVSDTGIGIVPEKQKQILNTFIKVYDKANLKYEGSGLELAIINQLIQLQGGSIKLESEPGKGTTFMIDLPFKKMEENQIDGQKDDDTSEVNIEDLSVLLVEDNEFNVMVASSELEDTIPGVQVDIAENGKIALEMIDKGDYDIVLMDVQMPVMDGFEATRQIRKRSDRKSAIPVIAMTANVMKSEIDRCFSEGMNDYLSKPFETDDLLLKIKKCLQKPGV